MVHIIPKNAVSEEEKEMQRDVREILFHAITRRSFLEYPDLYPFLQQHWKKTEDQDLTKDELDEITSNVHPDLLEVWQPEVTKMFKKFIDAKQLKDFKDYSTFSGLAMNSRYSNKKISALRKAENTRIKKEYDELLNRLPSQVANLNNADFLEFKEYFFKERNIMQCVEPFFAKILGHEQFLPMSISGQTNQTNIKHFITKQPLRLGNIWPQDVIEPCSNRCQYHVLGHTYMGDITSSHSADQLNNKRQSHGVEGLPNRFSVGIISKILEPLFILQNNSSKS